MYKNRRKGKIEINKVGEELIIDNGYKYKEIPLPKVEFELRANEDITIGGKEYYKYGDLVSILTTDKNGQTSIDGLPLGKYILIEKSTDKNHVLLDEPMEFELKYKDQYTKEVIKTFNIKNYYKKGTLEFTKTDLVDGTPIPNVEIQIFTENDELLFTGTTDNDGKITITDLPVGVKMYLVETRAADNYKLTDKRIYFEILENGDIVRAILTNEKIVIDVPKTGLDKNYFMELISSILIAAGIGGIAFEIIKKRKRK